MRWAPERRVFVVSPPATPEDRPLMELARLCGLLSDVADLIVWVDDAHEHFDRGLSSAVLDEVFRKLPRALFVMTVHQGELARADAPIGDQVVERLRRASSSTTLSRTLSDQELTRARTLHPDLASRDDTRFLAEILASVPLLRLKLMEDQRAGLAIVDAAVAWRNAGMTTVVSEDHLRILADRTVEGQSLTSDDFDTGMDWAAAPVSAATALLISDGSGGWEAFDAIAAERAVPLSDDLWATISELATDADQLAIGNTAYLAGRRELAEGFYRHAIEIGDTAALTNLGVLLAEQGDLDDAEILLRQACELGEANGMYNLGVLLERRSELTEAETRYRQAIELGHAEAVFNLGVLLAKRDELAEAETLYREAAELGHSGAIFNLGALLDRQDESEEAEALYRQAVELGHAGAMSNLGVMLERSAELDEAETLYREAAELGNTMAMYNLGVLLAKRDELAEAEALYRQAVELGHAGAMSNLGVMLERSAELDEAETLYREAAELGNTDAMVNLGLLLHKQGKVGQAETQWRRAAELDNTDAIHNLGVLLHRQGRLGQPAAFHRRAIKDD